MTNGFEKTKARKFVFMRFWVDEEVSPEYIHFLLNKAVLKDDFRSQFKLKELTAGIDAWGEKKIKKRRKKCPVKN